MLALLLCLLLSAQVHAQNSCPSLKIEAIYPCTLNFTLEASSGICKFSSCFTESPGNPQNQTEYKNCYSSCCPGFLVPNDQTRDSFSPCYLKFNQTPSLVPMIGILIGVVLLILYVGLPCCENRYCPLFRLRVWICCMTKPAIAEVAQRVQHQVIDNIVSNQNLMKNELNVPGGDRYCLICNFAKASCELKCGHSFHIYCLSKEKENECPTCHSIELYPLKHFCKQCYANYELQSKVVGTTHKFKCLNCLLQ